MILKNFVKRFLNYLFHFLKINSEKTGMPGKEMIVRDWISRIYKTYSPALIEIFPKKRVAENFPGTIENKINWRFLSYTGYLQPAAFVLKIDSGRVYGTNGAVITPDGVLLSDVSREFGQRKRHTVFENIFLGRIVNLKGNVAVITTAGYDVYYHWMFDVLPRLYLLKMANLMDRIDFFILPELKYNFQKQTLSVLGIEDNKIKTAYKKSYFKADHLFVPSLPSLLGTVSGWACNFLRDSFLNSLRHNNIPNKKMIYLTRENANTRKIINERELIDFLNSYNVAIIDPGNLTIYEQVECFSQARVIIAPHGSALTNIVFCEKETFIIDIMPPSYIIPCFWILSNKMSLNYYYIIGKGHRVDEYSDYWHSENSDILLDLNDLRGIFKLIEIERFV
jgi:hypothetical protein